MVAFAQKLVSPQPSRVTSNRPALPAPRLTEPERAIEAAYDSADPQAAFQAAGLHASPPALPGFNFGRVRLLQPSTASQQLIIQKKLTVNIPGDRYEQEADQVAQQITQMPEPQVQRACSCGGACDDCKKKKKEKKDDEKEASPHLQRKAIPAISRQTGQPAPETSAAPASVHEVLRSPGQPLDGATRGFMEPRFGMDLSHVRVHADSAAAESARHVSAHAYAVGNHLVFGNQKFPPSDDEGRRLLAHELTHTVQQGSKSGGEGLMPTLQRQPSSSGCLACHLPKSKLPNPLDADKASKPEAPDQLSFEGYRKRPVTSANFTNWAVEKMWDDTVNTIGVRGIYRLLMRREDSKLDEWWKRALQRAGKAIRGSHEFAGTDQARERWVEFLAAGDDDIIKTLNRRAVDALVAEMKETLLSGAIPRGADLVKDPQAVIAIEEHVKTEEAKKETADMRRWGARMGVGQTVAGMRIVSADPWGNVIFEVIGHEGIYFNISDSNFGKIDPFTTKVKEEVTKGTAGLRVIGSFIKGFLTALASPAILVLDTGAKIIDMLTLATAAGVKWVSGKEIPYTCISSTCQNYNACIDGKKKTSDECQQEALIDAVEQATIIVPLYRQGAECLNGDPEACGAIAALAVGLVEEGGARLAERGKEGLTPGKMEKAARRATEQGKALSKAEMEDAIIREAIKRPHESDARVAEGLEKPKAKSEPHSDVKAPARDDIASPRSKKDLATDKAVHESARQAGSELKLSDSQHGVAAYGEGEEAGITLCSAHCTLVRKELNEVVATLPDDYAAQTVRDLKFLAKKAEGIDNLFRKGKISKEVAERASRDIAAELQKSVRKDPNLDQLLQMSPDYLKANRARLKNELHAAKTVAKQPPAASGASPALPKGRYPEGQSGNKTPTRIKPDPVTARPKGTPTVADADVLSQRGIRKGVAYRRGDQHHIFPQETELQNWFKEKLKGEDIHEYTVTISEGEHQAIHKTGKGGVVKGVQEPDLVGWNQEWKAFKEANNDATPQQIFEEAGRLMNKYHISEAPISRYGQR